MKVFRNLRYTIFILLLLVLLYSLNLMVLHKNIVNSEKVTNRIWEIQSIDTMKYSRDLAREKKSNSEFDLIIDEHVKNIAQTGATHVAVGTPYDEEFIPFLEKWVNSARKHGLNVWFRGNFAGWEEWFDYSPITREEHLSKTKEFILQNKHLFRDGDIFSSCPECENGGPGDPRFTGDVEDYREFLIDEYAVTSQAFDSIGVDVKSNYFSMNGDVAQLIMNKQTTTALGGIVVVDHYVESPQKLADDIIKIGERSGGEVVLGEFGAPVPDIHGRMTDEEQAEWLNEAISLLVENPKFVGMNYWVSYGGSTKIWNDDGTPKPAVEVIKNYYSPEFVELAAYNKINHPIKDVTVRTLDKNYVNGTNTVRIPIFNDNQSAYIEAPGYYGKVYLLSDDEKSYKVVLNKKNENVLFKVQKLFFEIIN